MGKFTIQPHGRLQEWIADEKPCARTQAWLCDRHLFDERPAALDHAASVAA